MLSACHSFFERDLEESKVGKTYIGPRDLGVETLEASEAKLLSHQSPFHSMPDLIRIWPLLDYFQQPGAHYLSTFTLWDQLLFKTFLVGGTSPNPCYATFLL